MTSENCKELYQMIPNISYHDCINVLLVIGTYFSINSIEEAEIFTRYIENEQICSLCLNNLTKLWYRNASDELLEFLHSTAESLEEITDTYSIELEEYIHEFIAFVDSL